MLLLFILILFTGSCEQGKSAPLEMETLFSLSLGRMEDQIDIMQREGEPLEDSTFLFMRNGLFYISNGASGKISEFTSYGDILSLYYNPLKNPEPFLVSLPGSESIRSTKKAYPFPFREIGDIAVSPDREVLVVDRISKNREEYDESLGVVLNRIILRFTRDGKFIDYLGQEGVGGTPLPPVKGLSVTERGDIVVVSRTPKVWFVYWYTKDGFLQHYYSFQVENLPVPEEGIIPSLDTIYPDLSEKKVFIKIDYYSTPKDASVRGKSKLDFYKSSILPFSMENNQYGHLIDLPRNILVRESQVAFETERLEVLYNFLGTAKGGYLFLMSPTGKNEQELLIMRENGRVDARVKLMVKDSEITYRIFRVTEEGILCGLLCLDKSVDVVWWRSDKLLEKKK